MVCGQCGKLVSDRLKRHFLKKHGGKAPFELEGKGKPIEPWCQNWLEVLEKDTQPVYIKKRGPPKGGALEMNSQLLKKKYQSVYVGQYDC